MVEMQEHDWPGFPQLNLGKSRERLCSRSRTVQLLPSSLQSLSGTCKQDLLMNNHPEARGV